MSAYLAYSYSARLTEKKQAEIDKKVKKNQAEFCRGFRRGFRRGTQISLPIYSLYSLTTSAAQASDSYPDPSKVKEPLGESICKMNISGYSLDSYKTFNPEGYTILCRLGEASDGFSYFPETSKIVLDTNQHSILMNNLDQLVPSIAEDLVISQEAAFEKSLDFFSNTQVTVQPTGIQGKLYSIMRSTQNLVPMTYTSQAVSMLKTTGMTGLQVIHQAPLTFVGATYIGALFFGYCGSVAGNNAVGLVCNTTSFALSRPMRGVEITLNGLILRPMSNLIGLPLILNGTQEMLAGKGLTVQEYTKIGIAFERISNSNIVKKAKKIYKTIREKDE